IEDALNMRLGRVPGDTLIEGSASGRRLSRTCQRKRRKPMVQFTVRTLAMIIGLLGVVLAFIINLLYSSLHVLGRITGITSDQSHFFWCLIVILIGLVGSLFVLFIPTVGVVLLLLAGIAFFFISGCWARLASPFLLISAFLAFRYSMQRQVSSPN